MSYTGASHPTAKRSKAKARQPDTWRTLVRESRSITFKWLQLSRRSIRLMIRTLLLRPVVIGRKGDLRTAQQQSSTRNYAIAWLDLVIVIIRQLMVTLWFLMRVLLWMYRGLTDPPQPVGPESKYRKRATGMSISPLVVLLALIGVLQLATFLVQ